MERVSRREIQPRAQAALATSPIFELREIRVEQQNGTLLLTGAVSSYYHKQLAQEVVLAVCRQCHQDELELINSIEVP
ncbi:MAG TPA: BON domain-containing protein [Planctomycetaceae bacterium]|nr:BON domain-containing protein [Planctomycetaceae bacterium]HIQ21358.1 BON domain-containing protein [Planctomycetota bacterium]